MDSLTTEELREQASRALAVNDLSRAADLFEEIARREPGDPRVAKRLARIYQELGRPQEALSALVRAANAYVARGAGIPAIAVCRWILELDPLHTTTLDRLTQLQSSEAPAPALLRARRAGASSTPTPTRTGRSAPLEELLLHQIVETTAPSSSATREGVREISLGAEAAPPPAPNELGGSLEGDPRKRAARQLVATPLFGRLPARALRRLIEAVRLVRLAEGEVLFRQGDPADALYVVADGAVVPIAEGETRRKLSVLEAGEFFGEIALVTDQPRNATVEALVDSELLAIDHQVIRTLLDEEPEMLAASLRFLRQRLVDRLLRTSELFASFDHRERARIARSFRLMEVQPDSVLIEQGLPADALHLVLAGELRVVTETADGAEAKEIAILRAGDPCGEMSLLAREPAMATVVASRRSWVLLLPRSDFDAVLDAHPGLREPLTCIAEARDSATDAAQRVADLELV